MTGYIGTVRMSDIQRCPKRSMLAGHYRDDGTCRCDEREPLTAELEALRAQRRELDERIADVRFKLARA